MTQSPTVPDADDLISVDEAASALGRSKRTIWDLARDHGLPRYRVAARGKTTLLRWGDVLNAYNAPRQIEAEPAPKKAAA
jgi:excisionase family DNA binding protein